MKRKGGVRGNQNNFEETERVICVRNFMLGKSHLNACYFVIGNKQSSSSVFFNSFGWVKKVDVIFSIVKGYELTTTYKT